MKSNISEDKLKEVHDFLFYGKKIQAIKVYKEATGLGLKDSKTAVETIEKKLRDERPEEFKVSPDSAGCSLVLLILFAPLLLGSFWFFTG